LAKKRYRSLSKILIGLISLWVGLLSFLVILLLNPREILIQTVQSLTLPPVALAAFYMSVLGSIVAVPAYIFGNDRIEASEASLFFYLQPLIAIPLATLMLKEPFSFYMFFALVLTSIGVIIAEKRFRLAKKRKT
jgi:drug/metabolite transporter (DMT)-like permease